VPDIMSESGGLIVQSTERLYIGNL
jgi:hypothetical protein